MMLRTIIIALLLIPYSVYAACDCGSTSQAAPCTGQYIAVTVAPTDWPGIANGYLWEFNSGGGDARCGQFASGDYWVAPAVGQTTVTVTNISSTSHGEEWIKADANPVTESMGLLLGTKVYGNYTAAENIIPILPQSYSGIDSLVAATQRYESVEGGCGTEAILGACVDSYHVVTVLPSVPENAGATVIRPNITGQTKELLTWSDFDLSKIPSKNFLLGTTADIANIKRRWSHSTEIFNPYSEGGRAYRSAILLDDYGAGVAAQWHNDLMTLFSDDITVEQKQPALAAMISYGLDLYHMMFDAPSGTQRVWGTGAAQHPGRFQAAALFASLASNPAYANNMKTVNGRAHDVVGGRTYGPAEMAQIHQGSNGLVWGDDPISLSGVNYVGSYWENLHASQCYDLAPQMELWDYYEYGEWKTFYLPIGQLATGELKFTIVASPGSTQGDLKIRNVYLDGNMINFGSVTLVNYANGTASGSIESSGVQYSIPANVMVKKQTEETYTVTSESLLIFDWYQTAPGQTYAIGFDDDLTQNNGKKLVQISGTYNASDFHQKGCNVNVGSKTMLDYLGYIDGPPNQPGSSYIGSSYGTQRAMVASMWLMPSLCDVVNSDELVKYIDRMNNDGLIADPDPCVTPDDREDQAVCDAYRNYNCTYYGVTWGPVNPEDKNSGCITTPTEGHNKVGRFSWWHGKKIGATYTSGQVENNWTAIRGTEPSCRSVPPPVGNEYYLKIDNKQATIDGKSVRVGN